MVRKKPSRAKLAGGSADKGRALKVKVKSARGRTVSSARWLDRQLNDPYVEAAKREGLRSRAAFKLAEIDDAYALFKAGQVIVDLGSAPGGWSQIAAERVSSLSGPGRVIAIDIGEMEALPGVDFEEIDFTTNEARLMLKGLLAGDAVDVVLSDMASPSTGHRKTDHVRIVALCEDAFDFARTHLKQGGTFLAKVLQGGTERDLLDQMKRDFRRVRHVKPKASRADSSETYVLATGFRADTSC